jgi:hypothetical protein
MAVTIAVTVQPTQGNVQIVIGGYVSGFQEFYAGVFRQELDGTVVPVRTYCSADPSGQYIETSFGGAILYDVDPPLDQPLVYYTQGFSNPAANNATAAAVILPSGGNMWLKDPIRPAGNLRVGIDAPPSLPDCKPGEGIIFAGMADQNFGTQSTNWSTANAAFPIPLTQVRAAPTSQLNLITRTFQDAEIVLNLLSTGDALCMDPPAKYGYYRRYIAVGDVVTSRVSRDYRRQWQTVALPYATSTVPGGQQYGTLGNRWKDFKYGPYATIADGISAGLTWTQMISGGAGPVGWNNAQLTQQQVDDDFQNWSNPDRNTLWSDPAVA